MLFQNYSMIKIFINSSRLIHWIPIFLNSIIVTLIVGGSITEGSIVGLQISCIASFSFVVNDGFDAKIDKLNWEKRMSNLNGKKRFILTLFSLLYLLIAFSSSIFYTPNSLAALLILTLILLGYNIVFKRVLFIGNVIAAITLMSPIGIPYILHSSNFNPFVMLILISGVIYNFSREIILDLVDTKGDLQNGRHTFPVVIGQKISTAISLILYVLAFLILIFSPLFIRFEFKIIFQILFSAIFILLLSLSFPKLKFLINTQSQNITLKSLQPFITYSRLTLISFPVVLLIYYFLR
jgi:geranylgeranylglycerol-phosphate geranylgeranyltransferase